jgi:hypothetical protein
MRRPLVASLCLAAAAAALWLAMPAAAPPAPAAMANEPTAASAAAAPAATAPIARDATPVDGPASAAPAVARQAAAPLPTVIDDFAPDAWRQHVRQVGDGEVEVRVFRGTAPLADANVLLHTWLPTDDGASWPGAGALLRQATTDAEGRVRWAGLPPGSHTVHVEHGGLTLAITAEVVANDPYATQPESAFSTMALFGTATIIGVLRDAAGQPIAQARVGVLELGALPFARRVVTTAADGTFRCEQLPAGEHDVSVHLPGWTSANARRRVTLAPRQTVELELAAAGKR